MRQCAAPLRRARVRQGAAPHVEARDELQAAFAAPSARRPPRRRRTAAARGPLRRARRQPALELDVWLPEEAPDEPLPVIVFVHGGAWRTGLRDDLGPRFRTWRPGPFARLVRAGSAVVCPDHRLSGEAVFPAPLDDLGAALAWLRARAADLGIDAERVVAWGESAGGHLAALLALTAGPPLRGCVVRYGATDLTAAPPRTPEAGLLGAPAADAPHRAREAGPVARVTPGAPPFLILHGRGHGHPRHPGTGPGVGAGGGRRGGRFPDRRRGRSSVDRGGRGGRGTLLRLLPRLRAEPDGVIEAGMTTLPHPAAPRPTAPDGAR
ncbi:alpha/beta hydrolase fold domain-containing protein [Streptomyces flaveolus]|uniref:alpha/beta hydrolase fold domain-containing protein n=1 Tax=Streptomyces flaveolus TaxID=67297 RepID=UPI0037F5BBF4